MIDRCGVPLCNTGPCEWEPAGDAGVFSRGHLYRWASGVWLEWTEFSHGTRDAHTAEQGRPGIGTPDGLNLDDGTTDVDIVARVAADLTAAATLARSLPTGARRARPRGLAG
jgi:hypothetical protein